MTVDPNRGKYSTGTYALVDLPEYKNVLAVLLADTDDSPWVVVNSQDAGGMRYFGLNDYSVTNVRPQLVINVEEAIRFMGPRYKINHLLDDLEYSDSAGAGYMAQQIRKQIIEPGRIYEPIEVGSLVKDFSDCLWARGEDSMWICLADGMTGAKETWSNIDNPTLLRGGVDSDA